jgi:hypothetical protein
VGAGVPAPCGFRENLARHTRISPLTDKPIVRQTYRPTNLSTDKPIVLSFRAAKARRNLGFPGHAQNPDPSLCSGDNNCGLCQQTAGETPHVSPESRYSERRKSKISCFCVVFRLSKFSSTLVASLPLLS